MSTYATTACVLRKCVYFVVQKMLACFNKSSCHLPIDSERVDVSNIVARRGENFDRDTVYYCKYTYNCTVYSSYSSLVDCTVRTASSSPCRLHGTVQRVSDLT